MSYAPKVKVSKMDSRVFIREAAGLITDIKTFQAAYLTPEEEMSEGTMLQKRIAGLFGSLQNPTLPSAYKLRDAALGAGFAIDSKRLHLLASFETLRA